MKEYLDPELASSLMTTIDTLEYPYYETGLVQFPPIPDSFLPSREAVLSTTLPDKLVVEATRYIGYEPQRILDAGCGMGRNALYLAMNGHEVVALDSDKDSVDWARERARDLGIPNKNFIPRIGNIKDLGSWERYHTVISTMVLHFFSRDEINKVAKAYQEMAEQSGVNVVSVYTDDNPEYEKTKRGLGHMFKLGELATLFPSDWVMKRNEEGYSHKIMYREYGEGRNALIPTVAEVIAIKPASSPKRKSYMDANRQLIYVDL